MNDYLLIQIFRELKALRRNFVSDEEMKKQEDEEVLK